MQNLPPPLHFLLDCKCTSSPLWTLRCKSVSSQPSLKYSRSICKCAHNAQSWPSLPTRRTSYSLANGACQPQHFACESLGLVICSTLASRLRFTRISMHHLRPATLWQMTADSSPWCIICSTNYTCPMALDLPLTDLCTWLSGESKSWLQIILILSSWSLPTSDS